MKAQSTKIPEPWHIRKLTQHKAYIIITKNVEEVEETFDGEIHSKYVFDRVEIELPRKLATQHFIEENLDALYDAAEPTTFGRVNEDADIVADTVAYCLEKITELEAQ